MENNQDTDLTASAEQTTPSSIGDQYPDVTNDATLSVEKNGRFVVGVADLEKVDFENNGEFGLTPHENEILFDNRNIPYIVRKNLETGALEPKSGIEDIVNVVQMLIDTGVIKSAYSLAMDCKVYRIYFDSQKRTVCLDSSLEYDTRHMYYAIRKHELDSNGRYQYVSGIRSVETDETTGESTDISSHLISFLKKRNENGETFVHYAGQGGLLEELVEGELYVVDYFSTYGKKPNSIGSKTFQAISVRSMEYAMTPETAIRDLLVVPNNSINGDPDSTYLYVGDNPVDALSFRVFLKFADDNKIDITNQQTAGGRLEITGLDEIVTDSVSLDETSLQKITFTYYFGEDNSNDDTSGETESGAILHKEDLSITKEISVYIRENAYDKVIAIEPTGWITPPTNDSNQEVLLKIIALYEDGRMSDITHQLRDNIERFSGFGNGTSVYDVTRQAFVAQKNVIGIPTESCYVRVPNGSLNGYDKKEFFLQTTSSSKRLIVDNESSKYMEFNPNTKMMNFYGNPELSYLTGVTNSVSINGQLIQPTHVTIRSALQPDKVLVNRMNLNSIPFADGGKFVYSNLIDGEIQQDYPLLVEFIYILQDLNGLNVSVRTTAIHTYYCKLTSL